MCTDLVMCFIYYFTLCALSIMGFFPVFQYVCNYLDAFYSLLQYMHTNLYIRLIQFFSLCVLIFTCVLQYFSQYVLTLMWLYSVVQAMCTDLEVCFIQFFSLCVLTLIFAWWLMYHSKQDAIQTSGRSSRCFYS